MAIDQTIQKIINALLKNYKSNFFTEEDILYTLNKLLPNTNDVKQAQQETNKKIITALLKDYKSDFITEEDILYTLNKLLPNTNVKQAQQEADKDQTEPLETTQDEDTKKAPDETDLTTNGTTDTTPATLASEDDVSLSGAVSN